MRIVIFNTLDYFFKRLQLDTFVQSDDGTASSMELLNGAADLPKSMTASHAEVVYIWFSIKLF